MAINACSIKTPELYSKVYPNLVKLARFSGGSKEAFAKSLKDYRQSFQDSDDEFVEVVWQIYNSKLDNFVNRNQGDWTKEDFKVAIFEKINKPEPEELPSKEEKLEGSEFLDEDSDSFIDLVYGTSTAKDKLLREFNTNIVRSIFLDLDNGLEISSLEQANDRIISYQELLFLTILNAFRRKNIPFNSLYNTDGTNNLKLLNYILSDLQQEYNIRNLQLLSSNTYMKTKFDALNALFILNYFDKMLVSQFNKNASINHSEGLISNDNKKYSFNLGNRNKNTQWRDDNKDIDALEEVSNITKRIIESLSIPLKIDQVVSINTLVKALAHHPAAQESLDFLILEDESYLRDIIEDDMGRIKSLYDLINDSINDLVNGIRNLYALLASDSFLKSNLCKDTFRIYTSKLKLLKNIYEAIFSETNSQSLYNIYLNSLGDSNIDEQPEFYYTYVTQMLGSQEAIDSQEYNRIKGIVENITLKQKQNSTQTYYIDNKIGGAFNVNLNRGFDTFATNVNNLNYDNGNNPSIEINIQMNDSRILTITKEGKSSQLKFKLNGTPIGRVTDEMFEKCSKFLKEATGFEFTDEFISKLLENKSGYVNLTLNMASNIIYNYELSKKLLNQPLTKDEYEKELSHYYKEEEIPSVRTDVKLIQYTSDVDAPIKIALAETYDDVKGINRNTVQRDASNKQIASNGLDQIATKVTAQWSRSNLQNSALAELSINKIYEGQEFGRDFKGPNGIKAATAFTESENFIASFMYDYLNNIYGEGVIKILPSVISDKSRIPKTKFNLNKESSILGEDGKPKKFKDLTVEEWKTLTVAELGNYYKSIYDDSVKMWNELAAALFDLSTGNSDLNTAIRLVGTTLDYNTNFREFNARLAEAVQSESMPEVYKDNKEKLLSDIIHNGVIQALKNNSNFELTSVIHYSARNGELKGNSLLFDLLYRYGKLENPNSYEAYGLNSGYGTFDEFLAVKLTQYIADLLKDDCEILLHDTYGNEFKDLSYKNLKKSGWTKGDNVVFARISYNYLGEDGLTKLSTIDITNKSDLKNQYIYKQLSRLKNLDAYKEVKDYINIDSPYFSFDKFNEAINIYNNTVNSLEAWTARIKKAIRNKGIFSNDALIDAIVTPKYINTLLDSGKADITLIKELKDAGITNDSLLAINSKLKSAIKPVLDKMKVALNAEPIETNLIFEMNPALEKYQATEYFLSSEYMNATVGTHINHPSGKGTLRELESAAWGQLVKRNVSLTASKYKFALNLLDGIRSQYTIAVIEDDKDIVYNIYGKKDKAKPFDGATFCAITTNYLENKSLKGDKAGIDKKQFIHDYKANSGTGIIVKTAGFAITNGRLRDSDTLQRMNRKMLDIKYDTSVDITKDYNDKLINYGDIIYNENGVIYRTVAVNYHPTEQHRAVITRHLLTDKGWIIAKPLDVLLNSNYQVWQHVFGGHNSVTLQTDNIEEATTATKFEYSENSCRLLAYAMNKVGVKKSDIVTSQQDVDQIMKRHVIDYVVTEGAIKQGAANVNSRQAYFDDNYEWTTMKLNMYDAGIQLDAEHHADNSTLSLMTQVLNVLGARGYSSDEAEETYQALRSLTKEAIKQFDLGLIGIKYGDSTAMLEFLTDIILQSIKTVGSGDGSLITALSSNIISEYSKGNRVTYDLIRNNMPISNPATFNKMISSLAAVLTKKCIRIKFPGSLSVLSPSNRIYKIFNGHLLSHYDGKLPNLGYLKLNSVSDIKMGRTYRITYSDGTVEELLIDDPDIYWRIKDLNPKIIEENLSVGRDLSTYGVVFSDGINVYNMWDLAEVRRLYKEDNSNTTGLLLVLNNLKVGGTVTIQEGEKKKEVVIRTMEVEPYELIMTKIYETTFGLKKGDDVLEIVNNKLFFCQRLIENLERKVSANNYDVELKVLNGQHVYLVDSRGIIPGGLRETNIRTRYDGDLVILIDANNNKIRTLSSENDKIYIDSKGNEVIVTDNINYYIANTNFALIGLSYQSSSLDIIIKELLKSDKAPVQALLENLQIIEESLIDVNSILSWLEKGQKLYDEDLDILKRNLTNPNIDLVLKHIKSKVVINLINSSLETHTSFLKSLKVLAARIPAQSHQSFMAMKVVGFDDSGVNTAYVSRMQIWLQGSDFKLYSFVKLAYTIKLH